MTPEEINQLVAEKIMGWTPKPCDLEETQQEWTVYDDGYCWCPRCKVREHISTFEHGIIPPPRYSTDMNAAWLVLQHIDEEWDELIPPFAYNLGVTFATSDGFDTFTLSFGQLVRLTPEKICKAVLKTIGAI